MTTKNLLVAGLLVLGAIAVITPADASAVICDAKCQLEKLCYNVNCDVPCPRADLSASVCIPVCPVYSGSSSWVCPQPPNPCYTWDRLFTVACPICPYPITLESACPAPCREVSNLCGLCDAITPNPYPCGPAPPLCDLRTRECYTVPIGWECTANDQNPEGLVPATVDYAQDMGAISCGLIGGTAMTALEQTSDSAYFAASQAFATYDYVASLQLELSTQAFNDHGLVDAAKATATNEVLLACAFALGGYTCAAGEETPVACPADVPSSGGVLGATLAFADASCSNVATGGTASAAAAQAIAADAVAAGGSLADQVADSVTGFAEDRASDAGAFVSETEGNAATVVAVAEATVDAAEARTCTYLVGTSSCI